MMETRRLVALAVIISVLTGLAAGVAIAATKNWETVAVGAVWNRRMEAEAGTRPMISLVSETKKNPEAIRFSLESKNAMVEKVDLAIEVQCEGGIFGEAAFKLHRVVTLPHTFRLFPSNPCGSEEVGRCLVDMEVEVLGDAPDLGKVRAKIEASY